METAIYFSALDSTEIVQELPPLSFDEMVGSLESIPEEHEEILACGGTTRQAIDPWPMPGLLLEPIQTNPEPIEKIRWSLIAPALANAEGVPSSWSGSVRVLFWERKGRGGTYQRTPVPGSILSRNRRFGRFPRPLDLGKGRKVVLEGLPFTQKVHLSIHVPSGERSQFFLTQHSVIKVAPRVYQMVFQNDGFVQLAKESPSIPNILHQLRFVLMEESTIIRTVTLEFEGRGHNFETGKNYRRNAQRHEMNALDLTIGQVVSLD